MKKIFNSLLTIISLVGMGYFIWQNGYLDKFLNTDNTAVAVGAESNLYLEKAGVYLKPQGKSDYSEVNTTQTKVSTGDYLKTNATGVALLAFPDNSIVSLEPNTELQVNFSDAGVNIFQIAGATLHRVESVLQGKTYEVETSNVNAAVRGTLFRFEIVNKDEVKVYVIDHAVDISQTDKAKKVLKAKKIQTGNMIDVITQGDASTKFADTKIPNDFTKKYKIDEKLQQIDDLFKILAGNTLARYTVFAEGSMTCKNYQGSTPDTILARLAGIEFKYADITVDKATVGRLVNATSTACKDGTISHDEIELIQAMLPKK